MKDDRFPWLQIMVFCLILFIASMGMVVISIGLLFHNYDRACHLPVHPKEKHVDQAEQGVLPEADR